MTQHPALAALAFALWLACAPATAQTPSPCVVPDDYEPARLYGLWQLTLWPEGGSPDRPSSRGAVLFERHPEYAGGVLGRLKRSGLGNDREAIVSGDVADGEFNLDESANGVDLDAVWTGVPQACGNEFQGTRRPAESRPSDEPPLQFLLKKASGWN
jgi:hypothetical protein